MKKKILGGIAVVVIAAMVAINVSLSANSNNLSNVSLANVEALANGDIDVPYLCHAHSSSWNCCDFPAAGELIAGSCN